MCQLWIETEPSFTTTVIHLKMTIYHYNLAKAILHEDG